MTGDQMPIKITCVSLEDEIGVAEVATADVVPRGVGKTSPRTSI